jgi:hypothetical protein
MQVFLRAKMLIDYGSLINYTHSIMLLLGGLVAIPVIGNHQIRAGDGGISTTLTSGQRVR